MHFGKNLLLVVFWITNISSMEIFHNINVLSETRVEESENIRILQEGGRHSLVITHVSSDTEGFYTAVAQNVYGKADCTAELYMQEPRAAITSHM